MWAHKPCLYGTEFAWSQCQIVSTFNMSLALKFMIIFQNLISTNRRKSGKSKYDCKRTELDGVTM